MNDEKNTGLPERPLDLIVIPEEAADLIRFLAAVWFTAAQAA